MQKLFVCLVRIRVLFSWKVRNPKDQNVPWGLVCSLTQQDKLCLIVSPPRSGVNTAMLTEIQISELLSFTHISGVGSKVKG